MLQVNTAKIAIDGQLHFNEGEMDELHPIQSNDNVCTSTNSELLIGEHTVSNLKYELNKSEAINANSTSWTGANIVKIANHCHDETVTDQNHNIDDVGEPPRSNYNESEASRTSSVISKGESHLNNVSEPIRSASPAIGSNETYLNDEYVVGNEPTPTNDDEFIKLYLRESKLNWTDLSLNELSRRLLILTNFSEQKANTSSSDLGCGDVNGKKDSSSTTNNESSTAFAPSNQADDFVVISENNEDAAAINETEDTFPENKEIEVELEERIEDQEGTKEYNASLAVEPAVPNATSSTNSRLFYNGDADTPRRFFDDQNNCAEFRSKLINHDLLQHDTRRRTRDETVEFNRKDACDLVTSNSETTDTDIHDDGGSGGG